MENLATRPPIRINTNQFSFSRQYVPNNYKSEDTYLYNIAQDLCLKNTPGSQKCAEPANCIQRILNNIADENKGKQRKKQKVQVMNNSHHFNDNTTITLNYSHTNSPLRYIPFCIQDTLITALVDSGSSHSLISEKALKTISPSIYDFTPLSLNMTCATGTIKNNITGTVLLKPEFVMKSGNLLIHPHHFLVCKNIANFQAILGDPFLTDTNLVPNLTPNILYMKNPKNNIYDGIDLIKSNLQGDEHLAYTSEKVHIREFETQNIAVIINQFTNSEIQQIYFENINNENSPLKIEPSLETVHAISPLFNSCLIKITNCSPDPVVIQKMTPVAIAQILSNDTITENISPECFLSIIKTPANHNLDIFSDISVNTKKIERNLEHCLKEFPSLGCPDQLDNHESFEQVPELIQSAGKYVKWYTNKVISSNPDILKQYLKFQNDKLVTLNTNVILDNNTSFKNFKLLQRSDEIYSNIITDLEKDKSHKTFKLSSGLLYKKLQTSPEPRTLLCIPTIILPHVTNTIHKQLNHPSTNQLRKSFYRYFFHPFSSTGIQATNRSCVTCCLSPNLKPTNYKIINETRPVSAKFPRHIFAITLITNLPKSELYSDILLVTDEYTKFVMFFPLKNKTSDCIFTALHQLFTYSGYTPYIRTENEPTLIQALQRILKLFRITLLSSAPYSHQQNDLAGKEIALFKQHITELIHDSSQPQDKTSWYQNLPLIAEYINSTICNKTQYTRAELFFGSTKSSPFSSMEDFFEPTPISTTYMEKSKPTLDKSVNRSKHSFTKGDIVSKKQEYLTVGTKKIFSTHFVPTLFKIISTPENSTNLILLDLKSGIKSTLPADKLQKIDLQTYQSFLPDNLFDTEILDKLKSSTNVQVKSNINDPDLATSNYHLDPTLSTSDPHPRASIHDPSSITLNPDPDPTPTLPLTVALKQNNV